MHSEGMIHWLKMKADRKDWEGRSLCFGTEWVYTTLMQMFQSKIILIRSGSWSWWLLHMSSTANFIISIGIQFNIDIVLNFSEYVKGVLFTWPTSKSSQSQLSHLWIHYHSQLPVPIEIIKSIKSSNLTILAEPSEFSTIYLIPLKSCVR